MKGERKEEVLFFSRNLTHFSYIFCKNVHKTFVGKGKFAVSGVSL